MIFEPTVFLTFVLACAAIVIVPGPSVTVIVANSVTYGTRAGLLNVAGTQAGLAIMVVLVAFGLEIIATTLAPLFFWLRVAGAAYLIWLGYKLLTADGTLGGSGRGRPGNSFFWQGFVVIWSNPKALLFFGAFIPQFIQSGQSAALQALILGATFMLVGLVLDGAYAIAAGKAGSVLTRRNVRKVEIGGGSMLIGGGAWLALARN